ncbi:MAG: MMPL family transporter [Clostridia bacterium]|nr:MMPL family transporter [Clostridia bacterium]
MKKLAAFLVDHRYWFSGATLILAIVSCILMNFVTINEDLTEYLPDDSNMKAGLAIMEDQFPSADSYGSFKFMFEGLTEEQKSDVYDELSAIVEADGGSVEYEEGSSQYNSGDYTLYVITSPYIDSGDTTDYMNSLAKKFSAYKMYSYYSDSEDSILSSIIPIALIIVIVILLIMCSSFFEPVLMIVAIGLAIVINMGTNIIFASVSSMTYSIAAVLQLILSIDYSVMLMNRYSQERKMLGGEAKVQAMKNTVQNAFGSVSSSAFTTIVGMLVLLMMSFTIGTDMGLVLAKGVLFSLVCVFTVMPTLILWSDKLLQVTNKQHIAYKIKQRKNAKKEADENVG